MTLKNYNLIRLLVVLVVAITFSQSIIIKNYLLPIIVLVVASLFLWYLRGKVKSVIADERDFSTAGRAAILAIQIFSWFAVVSMVVLYSFSDLNPYYEPVAMTLAYATCILMIFYSVIFKFYNKFALSDKKLLYSILMLLLFLIMAVASLRFLSGEDNWICTNGQWVKHGQPDFSAPTVICK